MRVGACPLTPAAGDVFGIGAIRRFLPDRLTSISPARSSCPHAARTVSRDTPTWAATRRSPGSSSPGRNTPLSTCSRTHRNTRPPRVSNPQHRNRFLFDHAYMIGFCLDLFKP
ncbi:hypothetical protein HNQ40_002102 [Algisphaera agarilytica]|uniref:Uncharacterized protein n=1 Tax=Algisphaera agarilytica TaxID=1385975 RepID=A0A7X0H901_9BACT|nr:hypothetical protein [Algisphaera agarilytica]